MCCPSSSGWSHTHAHPVWTGGFNKEPMRLEGESSEKVGKELERRKWGGGQTDRNSMYTCMKLLNNINHNRVLSHWADQRVKVPATKSSDLSVIPRTNIVDGKVTTETNPLTSILVLLCLPATSWAKPQSSHKPSTERTERLVKSHHEAEGLKWNKSCFLRRRRECFSCTLALLYLDTL